MFAITYQLLKDFRVALCSMSPEKIVVHPNTTVQRARGRKNVMFSKQKLTSLGFFKVC